MYRAGLRLQRQVERGAAGRVPRCSRHHLLRGTATATRAATAPTRQRARTGRVRHHTHSVLREGVQVHQAVCQLRGDDGVLFGRVRLE